MVIQRYGIAALAENLSPEFERCIGEARPAWFLMENVPAAPLPIVPGYAVADLVLNNRWVGGVQQRNRRFSFGVCDGCPIDLARYIEIDLFEPIEWASAVIASRGQQSVRMGSANTPKKNIRPRKPSGEYLKDSIRLQGLPADFLDHTPLTAEGKQKVVGNGVPLPLGRAIAKAVKAALEECDYAHP
jgi:DNA (cytosine-5)-methyltransferase 1